MLNPIFFQNVFTPLILGTASLLVMLTTRNASLSDRVRSATRLINDDHPEMPALRRLNLLDQIGSFHQRYILNELALAALAVALLLFLSMNLSVGHDRLEIATVLFSCGLISLAFGFILTGADIMRGMKTLDLEVQYTKRLYKPDAQFQEALKQQLVQWLQTDPAYAQTLREVLREVPETSHTPATDGKPSL